MNTNNKPCGACDAARAETQRLIELNRSHVSALCEAQRKQVEALKTEIDRLRATLEEATRERDEARSALAACAAALGGVLDYDHLVEEVRRLADDTLEEVKP